MNLKNLFELLNLPELDRISIYLRIAAATFQAVYWLVSIFRRPAPALIPTPTAEKLASDISEKKPPRRFARKKRENFANRKSKEKAPNPRA